MWNNLNWKENRLSISYYTYTNQFVTYAHFNLKMTEHFNNCVLVMKTFSRGDDL